MPQVRPTPRVAAVLLAAGLLAAPLAAQPVLDPSQFKTTGDKVTVNSPHFTIEAYNADLAKVASELAEKYLDELAQALLGGAVVPHKITIFIYKTKKDYHDIGKNPVWSGGVAKHDSKWGKPNRIELYQLDDRGRFDPETLTRTLPHELTHVILADLAGGKGIPIWLNEGLAQCFEKQARPQVELRGLAAGIEAGRYTRFKDVFAVDAYPQDVQRFYLQSESMARFLLSTLDQAQLNSFLKAAINRDPMDKALAAAFGIPAADAVDQVENRWAAWVAKTYGGRGSAAAAGNGPGPAALFAPFDQRDIALIGAARTWQPRPIGGRLEASFTPAGGTALATWKPKAGALAPAAATLDQPAHLGLANLPAGGVLVRFKVKRDVAATVPVRISSFVGGTPLQAGADLTDDNWHELIAVSVGPELAVFTDGKCTGRAVVPPPASGPTPLAISLYGPASIKDVDVAPVTLPQ